MTHEELARRRPLWDAMSDLFLDTEVRWHVPFIARRCAESGYDDEMLERIFWVEIFPEAIGNLLQVAGEWAALALDEAALIRRAEGRLPWLRRHLSGWMVEPEWRGACTVTSWLRALTEPRRTQFVDALDLCGRRYFETPGTPPFAVSEEKINAVRETLADTWRCYESVCRSMLLGHEAPTHDARAAAVRSLVERGSVCDTFNPDRR